MKRKYLLLLIPVSILCILLAKMSSVAAEYIFARGLFKIISVPLGFITGLLPFSIAEILVILFPVCILVLIGRFCYLMFGSKKMLRRNRKQVLKRWAVNMGVFISILLFLFTTLCGTNYYRFEFEQFCKFEVEEYSEEELYSLCEYLAEKVNESKKQLIEEEIQKAVTKETKINENNVVVLDNFSEVADEAKKAYQKLQKNYPVLKYSTGAAKPVLLSKYMSYTGIVGIYFPFTVEANVNTDVAGYNRPADMCHELAHLHGFMRENEANFISYLVCTNSDEAYFRYSGYMLGYIYATNALYDEDVKKYMQIASMLSDEVRADLDFEHEYWKQLESTQAYQTVEAVSDKVNDTYLKVNGQTDGVKSYGKMVDLLIAQYLAESQQ